MTDSQLSFKTKPTPIGIFDSGVGGITVVKALRGQLPLETLCYFGDTARVPYGTKSAETVQRYSKEITRFLMSHNAKIIVVACNTASSLALEEIQNTFEGPVVGVVEPGVRAAFEKTKNGRIGIIGTKSTIRSGSYQNRLQQQNPSLHIVAHPCPLFVPLMEEGWENDPITYDIACRYLEPLVREEVDIVILGCTHYPLLENVIQNVMGDHVQLVNSAQEAAKEVKRTLKELNLLSSKKEYKDLFYASDDILNFKRLYDRICEKMAATLIEAPPDFFALVQEVYRFKGSLFPENLHWFEAIGNDS